MLNEQKYADFIQITTSKVLEGLKVVLFNHHKLLIEPGKAVVQNAKGFITTASLKKPLVKDVRSLWQRGSQVGGRDTGVDENGTWRVYLIFHPRRRHTDVLLSLSDSPTLPEGYLFYCLICKVERTARSFEFVDYDLHALCAVGNWSTPENTHVFHTTISYRGQNFFKYLRKPRLPYWDTTKLQVRHGGSAWQTPNTISYTPLNFASATPVRVEVEKFPEGYGDPEYGFFGGSDPNSSLPSPGHSWMLIPYNAATTYVTDGDKALTVNATFPGNGAYAYGVLMRDGRVFLVPSNATNARIYDPETNTVQVLPHSFPGNSAYSHGVLLRDGRVFLCPNNATKIRIYDPTTNQITIASPTLPGAHAYYRSRLLNNGKVLLVPANSTVAAVYDPDTNTVTTGGSFPGSFAFIDAVPLFTGVQGQPFDLFYFVPYNSTSALAVQINTTDQPSSFISSITTNGTFPSNGAFTGAVQLADGSLYFVLANATSYYRYFVDSNTLITFGSAATTSQKYYGAVPSPDGRYWIMAPYNANHWLYVDLANPSRPLWRALTFSPRLLY